MTHFFFLKKSLKIDIGMWLRKTQEEIIALHQSWIKKIFVDPIKGRNRIWLCPDCNEAYSEKICAKCRRPLLPFNEYRWEDDLSNVV